MIEAFFTAIILGLLGAFAFYVRETSKEKAKLINALIAKSAQEMSGLTLADNTQIKPEINGSVLPPDLVPTDQMTDEEFDQHIQDELDNVN